MAMIVGRERRQRRARFAGGCALGFAVSWNIANTGAMAPALAGHYHVALGLVGGLAATLFLGEVAVMIPGGRAIDLLGPRRIGQLALALVALGNVLLLGLEGIGPALAARFVVGLGVGLGFVAGAVFVQSAAGDRGTLAQGAFGGISLSAGGLALALVPQLEPWLTWRAPYLSAIAAVLAGALALSGTREQAGQGDARAAVSVRSLLTDPRLAVLGLLHASSFGLSVIVGNWVVALLQRNDGTSAGTAGAIAALTMLVGIVGRPLGGALARGRPRATLGVLASAALLGGAGTALLAASSVTWPAVLGAAAVGLAGGLPFGAAMGGAPRIHPEAPGAAVSTMNLYPVVTIVFGAPLLGLAFSLPGDGRAGFVIVAALWLASGVVAPRAAALACGPTPPAGD